MAKHHWTLREPRWKVGLVIKTWIGAFLSFVVLLIVGSMKFMDGAWVIIILVPILVYGLVGLNRAFTRRKMWNSVRMCWRWRR